MPDAPISSQGSAVMMNTGMSRVQDLGRPGLNTARTGFGPHAFGALTTAQGPPIPEPNPTPLQNIPAYCGLGWLFLMMGMVPELLSYVLHTNTYLLYVFAPPALLGCVVCGAIPRTLKGAGARYWMLFVGWMVLVTPLSTWLGGSVARDLDYIRYSLPLMFVTGGLITSWKKVRLLFNTVAVGGLVTLVATRLFASAENDRISLDSSGTIGNSNDLAAHMTIVIPFLMFVAMQKNRSFVIRILAVLCMTYGVWVMLGTASRGGLIAIFVAFLTILFYASGRVRMMMLAFALVLGLLAPVLLPARSMERLATLFNGNDEEAIESQASRAYLFQKSVLYTFQHPIFGVGPDQFGNYEGKMSQVAGIRGEWHATHCAFTQVSSECGIPALIFFVLGVASSFRMVRRTWKRAKREGFDEIANACFCYLTALAAFMTAITFLANAYRFYLPFMVGLAISMAATAKKVMDDAALNKAAVAAADPAGHSVPIIGQAGRVRMQRPAQPFVR